MNCKYNNGHNIPIEHVVNYLKHLGCYDIINCDYNLQDNKTLAKEDGLKIGREKRTINGMMPDFVCKIYDNKTVAVEIGNIYEGYSNRINKIQKLLDQTDYVVHIYADKEFYLLHCILYEKRVEFDNNIFEKIKNGSDILNELVENIDVKNKYKYPRY